MENVKYCQIGNCVVLLNCLCVKLLQNELLQHVDGASNSRCCANVLHYDILPTVVPFQQSFDSEWKSKCEHPLASVSAERMSSL